LISGTVNGRRALKALQILILDDHKDAREALSVKLSREVGLEVTALPASAPEAVSEALSASPDVVLMDIKTRLGNGLKLCHKLVTENPDVHVLILTSCASQSEIDQFGRIGVAGCLFKDLETDALLKAIRSLRNIGDTS